MSEILANGRVTLHCGDMLEVLATLPENSVDSVCCDPPYHLTSIVKRFGAETSTENKDYGKSGVYKRSAAGFMGKKWDGGDIAFRDETWAAVYRVLKPGGHLVAFSGSRTYHRMACAIEDGGFEVRDCLAWMYGSGFPKSHDVGKNIEKRAGAKREVIGTRKADDIRGGNLMHRATGEHDNTHVIEITAPATDEAKEWHGWGTALKPAMEPICLARKPLIGTVVDNVLEYGTGALHIDACRVEGCAESFKDTRPTITKGRWPANVLHDGSAEVVELFPDVHGAGSAQGKQEKWSNQDKQEGWGNIGLGPNGARFGDSGSVARFFYTAKADADDRLGSKHPTVKPLDLMQWLVRLVTPKGGTVLDCFSGTGTTGEAAFREGFNAILIEREAEYQNDIRRRMSLVLGGEVERCHAAIKASGKVADAGPLFLMLGGE